MPFERRHYLVLPLAAFFAVLPLILHGCSCGHDFDFHVINWFEAAKQFTHGTLHPHWAYTPAWNAGEPRFVFYPPLSWTIGALLGLIMPWTWTPIVYTWIALTTAGFALHHTTRSLVSSNAALIAATIYIVNPYMLYTAYERTAYAELLAAAWLPLLLHAILRERISVPRIAIPVALLWLTNAPAAVMGCYALALLTVLRLIVPVPTPHPASSAMQNAGTKSAELATTIAGTLLGLGLASFYIIPAAYERRFVQIAFAILPGLNPQDNFLFHRTADVDHDTVLRTASVVAVILLALTTIVLTVIALFPATSTKNKIQSGDNPGAPFMQFHRMSGHSSEARTALAAVTISLAILALVIAFMLTPLSAPLWHYMPQLRFLQFPWRLTAILAAVFALSLAIALSRIAIKSTQAVYISLAAAIALITPAYIVFHQRCYPEDTLPQRLAIFASANPGTDPTDEYTPTTADNDALAPTNPAYWLAEDPLTAAPKDSMPGLAPQHLDLSVPSPQTLIFNLRDYPAWRVTLNGSVIATRLHRDDGLIAVPLPAGPSRIDVAYTTLNDQRIGYLITVLSLLLLTILLAFRPNTTADTQPPC